MKKTIGLTGSIATGKSTVSNLFSDKGIPVIDADVAAREVVQKETVGLKKIAVFFGEEVLNDDGSLNRPYLGELIFNDQKKREALNKIVHPLVKDNMLAKRNDLFQSGANIVIFDIPLLFESHLETLVDQIIVVKTSREVQLSRLIARNHLNKKQAIVRINSQMSLAEKCKRADYVIDNNGDLNDTEKQVNIILAKLTN
ncbi:dephospho-CoA kinase [Listeria sp. PSOL-1]|uniref:dephospho-CoA kinase n=1 Tax=Listeria sp. PSOL-1 TaxID=1844999 RepID=UPI0013CF5FEA|nr:dephospho-CoA kinase [Listeria sp. PSOL-1]